MTTPTNSASSTAMDNTQFSASYQSLTNPTDQQIDDIFQKVRDDHQKLHDIFQKADDIFQKLHGDYQKIDGIYRKIDHNCQKLHDDYQKFLDGYHTRRDGHQMARDGYQKFHGGYQMLHDNYQRLRNHSQKRDFYQKFHGRYQRMHAQYQQAHDNYQIIHDDYQKLRGDYQKIHDSYQTIHDSYQKCKELAEGSDAIIQISKDGKLVKTTKDKILPVLSQFIIPMKFLDTSFELPQAAVEALKDRREGSAKISKNIVMLKAVSMETTIGTETVLFISYPPFREANSSESLKYTLEYLEYILPTITKILGNVGTETSEILGNVGTETSENVVAATNNAPPTEHNVNMCQII